ncbi:hypothetical protein ACTWQB_13270 [Piscibacillus sp. B03]|uniref:hypothetical protein n=1 Tax=Piscibacillus sp. B03 TaxID=3457430 RepID=UPI003FCE6B54
MPFLKALININAWSHIGLVIYGLIFDLPYETYFSISSKIVVGSIFVYLLIGIFVDMKGIRRMKGWLSNKG